MIKRYKNKKHKKVVTASQWNGDNIDEIKVLVSPDVAIEKGHHKLTISGQDITYFSPVSKGEMVVRPENGVCIGLNVETFNNNYIEVENE